MSFGRAEQAEIDRVHAASHVGVPQHAGSELSADEERAEYRNLSLAGLDHAAAMVDAASPPGTWPPLAHDAQNQVLALAEQVRSTVSVARGLLSAGRRVDLAGLDSGIGLLCAKALDLPPQQGRAARVGLLRLAAELDALAAAMRAGTP